MKIKITWKYCLAFYCMIMLYASFHELIHHFAGYVICGDWGYKSFNYFKTACSETNNLRFLATFSGPILNFVAMGAGAYILMKAGTNNYRMQFGFALIFAQLPLQRMINPIFSMNDEFYAAASLWGNTPFVYWSVIIVIWAICIPPLVIAYRKIENRYRIWWFLFYLVLFPYLIWGPVFGGLEYLLVSHGVMNGTVIGIANLFILNEIVTIVGYLFFKKYFDTEVSDTTSGVNAAISGG